MTIVYYKTGFSSIILDTQDNSVMAGDMGEGMVVLLDKVENDIETHSHK